VRTTNGGDVRCRTCREGLALRRGCCWRCYQRHQKAVSTGEATWAALEAEGRCLPRRPFRVFGLGPGAAGGNQ
jgi:hypothetical protein